MQAGSVIVYRERGQLAIGVVQKILPTTAKTQIDIFSQEGKKQTLTRDRVILDYRRSLSLAVPAVELRKQLHEIREEIQVRARQVALRELWELLQEESGNEFAAEELAGYLLRAPAEDPLAAAAVLDALWSQSLYFKEKRAGFFIPRDTKAVEERLHQEEVEAQRAHVQGEFLAWTRERLAAPGEAPPHQFGVDRYLDVLKGLALHGDNYDKKAQALSLLDDIGFRGKGYPADVAFQLLVALGVWRQDEELSLLRYQIPTRFSAEVLQEAAETPEFSSAPDGYSDLTALLTFTIDDEETSEIDDALSLTEQDGTWSIGVHIADAGFFVPPNGLIDKAALNRGATVYLPRGKLPMLPPALGDEKASLVAGTIRPTLSFFATLDADGQVQDERICRGVIRVGRRLSYTEADALLQAGGQNDVHTSVLRRLNALAQRWKALRIAQGAAVIDSEEVRVRVTDREVTVTVLPADAPAHTLVSECMILANQIAARYCLRHSLPALYVRQPPPDEPVPLADTFPTQRVYVHAARRLMKPSQIGMTPASHAALGVDVYTQVTSPLRRYHDLQMHHQIKHHLAQGVPLFDEERVQVIAAGAQASSSEAKRCERESTRYWLLRFLEKQKGGVVTGQVVREHRGRSFIELDETLLVVAVSSSPPLPLGSSVQVVIGHVDARRDILTVRLT